MTVFEKILVAYDGSTCSQKALEKAIELMDGNQDVQIHVVNIMNFSASNIYGLYGPSLSREVVQEIEDAGEKVLLEAKKLTVDCKDACHFQQLRGNPADKVIQYANEKEMDLIVIGSRGLGAVKGMLLGSVSQRVVQQAQCHVLVIK